MSNGEMGPRCFRCAQYATLVRDGICQECATNENGKDFAASIRSREKLIYVEQAKWIAVYGAFIAKASIELGHHPSAEEMDYIGREAESVATAAEFSFNHRHRR